jgi:hypothetical protein
MWLKSCDLTIMSRMEEFTDHKQGRFSLTGWAGTGSLSGMFLHASVPLRFYGQF